MIETSHTVSTTMEPPQPGGAEASWAGRELSSEQIEPRGKRILLAEDDEALRACLREMLQLDGHLVTEAGNGADALKLFNTGEFNLVVTDFEMPLVKGNELAASIKRLAPSLPILMITASARPRRGAENPVDALLFKPFTVTHLRRALRKMLSAQPDAA